MSLDLKSSPRQDIKPHFVRHRLSLAKAMAEKLNHPYLIRERNYTTNKQLGNGLIVQTIPKSI